MPIAVSGHGVLLRSILRGRGNCIGHKEHLAAGLAGAGLELVGDGDRLVLCGINAACGVGKVDQRVRARGCGAEQAFIGDLAAGTAGVAHDLRRLRVGKVDAVVSKYLCGCNGNDLGNVGEGAALDGDLVRACLKGEYHACCVDQQLAFVKFVINAVIRAPALDPGCVIVADDRLDLGIVGQGRGLVNDVGVGDKGNKVYDRTGGGALLIGLDTNVGDQSSPFYCNNGRALAHDLHGQRSFLRLQDVLVIAVQFNFVCVSAQVKPFVLEGGAGVHVDFDRVCTLGNDDNVIGASRDGNVFQLGGIAGVTCSGCLDVATGALGEINGVGQREREILYTCVPNAPVGTVRVSGKGGHVLGDVTVLGTCHT